MDDDSTEQASNYSPALSGGEFTYAMLCDTLDKIYNAPMWPCAEQQQAAADAVRERLDRWHPGWREQLGA